MSRFMRQRENIIEHCGFEVHQDVRVAVVRAATESTTLFPLVGKPIAPPAIQAGSIIDVVIYEDDIVIEELTLSRATGNPKYDAQLVELWINEDASYSIEVQFTANAGKGSNNGAVPLKIYLAEGGELTNQIERTLVNDNNGKSPKGTAALILDEVI